jgi:spermidine synthase
MPDRKILSDKPANQPVIVNELGFLALHLDGGNFQSLMRKSQPHRLELGYTRIMMGFLLFNPLPRHIAMIGLGGGSLPKHCYRHLRETSITVIEINPGVIALREHFHVPADNERFEVVCADGADYVAGQKATLDVLMVDGFDTAGQAPQLCTRKFYQDAYASLREGGVMVVNILGADTAFDSYLADIGNSFGDAVTVVPSEDCDNKIVFAVKTPKIDLQECELMARAEQLEAQHGLKFRPMGIQMMGATAG